MSWIQTCLGNRFDFLHPHESVIDIEEIAHALSLICRFTGHTSSFYSVAQHSVHVSHALCNESFEVQMCGLLHDAAEAYVGDVSLPLKRLLPDYKGIEKNVERAVFSSFGLSHSPHASVKQADLILLATERRDLMPQSEEVWAVLDGIAPLPFTIIPMQPEQAYAEFLSRYEYLKGARK